MSKTFLLKTAIHFILSLVFSKNLTADKMSLETHQLVIAKIEKSLNLTQEGDLERHNILIRLGDLYSEKARLQEIKSVEDKCKNCNNALKSRKTSLQYYEKAQKLSPVPGATVVQMAHLYNLVNQKRKSLHLYTTVANAKNGKYSPELIGLAHKSLGEAYYNKSNFKKALFHYRKSLNYPQKFREGYIRYQMAWTHLNLGQPKQAKKMLIKLLSSPSSLQTNADEPIDKVFQEQASKDLAVFFARGKVNLNEIQQLYQLSPDHLKIKNIKNLAEEIERLGGFYSSIDVWRFYAANSQNNNQKLESEVHIAELLYKVNQKTQARKQIQRIEKKWNCHKTDLCSELQKRLKNLIVGWNKEYKHKPTQNLLQSYISYANIFPSDLDMSYWSAQLAFELKNYSIARKQFRMAHQNILKSKKAHPKKKKGALYGELESTELIKNKDLKLETYHYFIKNSQDQKKNTEVLYQIAYIHYENKKYNKSLSFFDQVAISPHSSLSNKKKSMDLVLDSLSLLKDDKRIESYSLKYATLQPKYRNEYFSLYRKSLINQADKSKSLHEKKTLSNKMKKASLAGANANDRYLLFSNISILEEFQKNYNQSLIYSQKINSISSLTKKQKIENLRKTIYLSNLLFKFRSSFKANKELFELITPSENDLLNMALIKSLAGYNPTDYYNKFIKKTRSYKKANLARLDNILYARKSWSQLNKNLSSLKKTPDVLALATLEVYAKYPYKNQLKKLLKKININKSIEGQYLNTLLNKSNFLSQKQKINKHNLRSSSQWWMTHSIKKRSQLLEKLESSANQMISEKNEILQISYLTVLSKEYLRFHKEILKLPTPKKLNKQQIKEYKGLVSKQAQPYYLKHQKIENKLKSLWNKNFHKKYISYYELSSPKIKNILRNNLSFLSDFSPTSVKSQISHALSKQNSVPSQKLIQQAQLNLIKDPLNKNKVKTLKRLEHSSGNMKMVAFLDNRLRDLKSGSLRRKR